MDFKLNKSNLNFRVYTAATIPSTAQENDICIISDVPMKNWILSPDAPSGAPRTDGDVWIRYSVFRTTNGGSTVNVLKTGAMMVATIAAWQYVNGAWVDRTAKSYQDGAWTDWFTGLLYKNGKKYDEFSFTTVKGTITENLDHLLCKMTSSGMYVAFIDKKYDLAEYKSIRISWRNIAGNASCGVGVYTGYADTTQVKDTATTNKTDTISLDVSGLSGEHVVGIRMYSSSSGSSAEITELELVR